MRLVLALLGIAIIGTLGWSVRLTRRLRQSERDRKRAADELNRRLSELFSLQELSFILSGSLQLERIVEQVVRYAMRFLDAQGALVALAPDGEAAAGGPGAGSEDRPLLRVTAADGTLAALAGRSIGADDPGLVVRSLGRERLELVRDSGGETTTLVAGVQVDSAAAAGGAARGHAGGWGRGPRDPGHRRPHPRTGGGARPERRGAGRGRDRPAGDGVPSDPERKTRRGGPARVRGGP